VTATAAGIPRAEPGDWRKPLGPRPAAPPSPAAPLDEAWPAPPGPEAYLGLAGDVVHAIEPHSEADPVALLLQTLVLFGNAAGRGPHFLAEGTPHFTNEFAVIVGGTASGRKGTSYERVVQFFAGHEDAWIENRTVSGVSSSEGLLWACRDPIERLERVAQGRGTAPTYETTVVDPGVEDKRLLVHEPEFANVLKQTERQGNTVSVYLRQLWDGRAVVQSLTKNNPAKATGAHVSCVGHITPGEFLRRLDATEAANGFLNRFLVACVRRSKLLPDGGGVPAGGEALRGRVAAALAHARRTGLVERDRGAGRLWHAVYPLLTEGTPGMAGDLTARAAPHVMRLALTYALLDGDVMVRVPHLLAATALWDYCDRSVRHLFGDATGDAGADEVRALLADAPGGLTRTELTKALGNRHGGVALTKALTILQRAGLARPESVPTAGRTAERWHTAAPAARASRLMEVARAAAAAGP
jgi:hypothetical protein